MNFQKLKYAVTVADAGSFREAARQLYMAQSSLSSAIRELEDEYQIEIFERTKRGINITEEGSEFLSYAREVLTQVNIMENRYTNNQTHKQLFSVTAQHYDFAAQAFAELIQELDQEEWDCRFLETYTQNVLEDVRTAYSELGILYINDKNERMIKQWLDQFNLEFVPLKDFEPHIFVGPHHPLAARESVKMADLAPYLMIKFQQSKGSTAEYSEEQLQQEVSDQSVLYASDRATVINWLAETDGYLIGSGLVTSPFSVFERVIPLEDSQVNHIGYIHAKNRELSFIAERYILLLKENLNQQSRFV